MSMPDIKVLITVASQTKAGLDSLNKQLQDIQKSLEGIQKPPKDGGADEKIRKTGEAAKDTAHEADTLAGSMHKLYETAEKVVKVFLAFEAVKLFKEFAQEGARVEGLKVGLLAVGEAAGYSATQIREASEAIESMGIKTPETQRALSKLITAGVGPEVGAQLAEKAKGLAVVAGQSTTEAFETITQAVASGQMRYLKRLYGISIDEQEEFKRRQQETGQVVLESQKKVILAEAAIREMTKFQAAAGTESQIAAGKLRVLDQAWDNFKDNLAAGVQPAFIAVIEAITIVVKALKEATESLMDYGQGVDGAIGPVQLFSALLKGTAEAIAKVIHFLGEHKTAVGVLAAALGAAAFTEWLLGMKAVVAIGPTVVAVIKSITYAVTAGNAVAIIGANVWRMFWVAVSGPVGWIAVVVGLGALMLMTERGQKIVGALVAVFKALWTTLVSGVTNGLKAAGAMAEWAWAKLTGDAKAAEAAWQTAARAVREAKAEMAEGWGDAGEAIVTAASAGPAPQTDLARVGQYGDLQQKRLDLMRQIEDREKEMAKATASRAEELKKQQAQAVDDLGKTTKAVNALGRELDRQLKKDSQEADFKRKIDEAVRAETGRAEAAKTRRLDLQAALQKAGADFEQYETGISAKFTETAGNIQIGLDALGKTADSEVARKGFSTMREQIEKLAATVGTNEEFLAFKKLLEDMSKAAKTLGVDVSQAVAGAEATAREKRDVALAAGTAGGSEADQRARQAFKTREQMRTESLKNEGELEKIGQSILLARQKEAYDLGLLNIDQYYEARAAAAKKGFDIEEREARAQIESLKRLRSNELTQTGRDQINAQIQQAELRLNTINARRGEDAEKQALEKRKELRDQERAQVQALADLNRLRGDEYLAQIAEINQKYADKIEKAKNDPAQIKWLQEAQAIEVANAALTENLRLLQMEIDRTNVVLDAQEARLNLAIKNQQLTTFDAEIAKNRILTERIRILGLELEKQKQIQQQALARGDDSAAAAAVNEQAKIAAQMDTMRAQFIDLGRVIQQNFTDAVQQSFEAMMDSILDKTVSLSQKLWQILGQFGRQISSMILKDWAEQATMKLAESTKGGMLGTEDGGSVFDRVAEMITGGKKIGETPQNAMWVRMVGMGLPGQENPLQALAGPAAGEGEPVVPPEMAQGFFGSLSAGFNTVISGVSSGFQGVLTTLGSLITSMFASSGGGGGGGWGGLIMQGAEAWADSTSFSVGMAGGGKVEGTGDGTSDSNLAWLSKGEHVINAEQAEKWRPLLEAINSGELDKSGLKSPQLPKFAKGGQVGAGVPIPQGGGGAGTRIVNVIDPKMAKDYMQSSEGEQVVLNILRRNSRQVQSVLV